MRILLTEGSGMTSVQVARRLCRLGHDVGVMSSDPLGIVRFSNASRRWHRVSPFGADPIQWLDECLAIYTKGNYEVLLPTQEQVTVLAAFPHRLSDRGVVTALPDFAALTQVQDKASASHTLERLGITQPSTTVVHHLDELVEWRQFPAFVKIPIGTASGGVWPVADASGLQDVAGLDAVRDAVARHGVVVQRRAEGQLAEVQSIWDHGRPVAFHATWRVREGAEGGASHKCSVELPEARKVLHTLGSALGWHGALAADVICGPDGPLVIDVNPRIVEPANAVLSGIDVVAAYLDVALGRAAGREPSTGWEGVRTHQFILAVLAAATEAKARRAIASESLTAALGRGGYADSAEECTPVRHDWRAALPVAAIVATTLAQPRSWKRFAGSSVTNYALTPAGWERICAAHTRACDQTWN